MSCTVVTLHIGYSGWSGRHDCLCHNACIAFFPCRHATVPVACRWQELKWAVEQIAGSDAHAAADHAVGACNRAALQAGTADPSLPIVASFGYAIWVFVKKRKNRNPDGPFWGNNPFWGAIFTTIVTLLSGSLVGTDVPWLIMQEEASFEPSIPHFTECDQHGCTAQVSSTPFPCCYGSTAACVVLSVLQKTIVFLTLINSGFPVCIAVPLP